MIVVTRDRNFNAEGCAIRHSLAEAIELAGSRGENELFVCGGAEIYREALSLCSELYLTHVKRVVEGDAFFPPFEDLFEATGVLQEQVEFRIVHYRRRPGT